MGLDPEVSYLNHGSFGATPRAVIEEQRRWQTKLEANPMAFLESEVYGALAAARQALAQMLSCDADDLALIENATSGVNTVLRSLRFEPGDEILVPDHAYQACRNTIDYVADRWGATVVTVNLPFHRRARGRDGAHHGRGDRPNGLGDDRHRDQPDRAEDAL